jgi:stage II sporulation protein E
MPKKKILSVLLYSAVSALLCLAEKAVGIKGLAFAFCLALVFCRENPVAAIAPYVLTSGLIHFDLLYFFCVLAAAFCAAFIAFIHYRFKKKYRLWANLLTYTVAQIPLFFINAFTTAALVRCGVGLVAGLVFHYVFIVAMYPFLVGGQRHDFSAAELSCAALFLFPTGIALASYGIYGVSFLYFAVALCSVILSVLGFNAVFAAVFLGAGASFITASPLPLCLCVLIGGMSHALRGYNGFLRAFGITGIYVAALYYFGETPGVYNCVPVAVACSAAFVPRKYYDRLSFGKKENGLAVRAMINRDREEVGKKLGEVASAFCKMQSLLESETPVAVPTEKIAEKIAAACCENCGKYAVCREKLGSMTGPMKRLVDKGMACGKASMLDADGAMAGVCVKLPKVVGVANEYIRTYKKRQENESGIELGKEMVISNLGGTAELLSELSHTVSEGFGIDAETEKRLKGQLASAGIVAGGAAIYGDGERVDVAVREADADKSELKAVISDVCGTGMYESERSVGINGGVNLVFRKNPRFGVLYGEKSLGVESECGDIKQAVRIASGKLMFILSDGMGTGADAKKTGTLAVNLIETFYRAGFGHKTIFGCVAKLLSLRDKESFSALDVAIMDTQTGEIDFIKQGGRESYVFHAGGVERIEGGTLPMGIVAESEPKIETKKLFDGDIVLLMSDGLCDRLSPTEITEIVIGLNTLNPQIIAEKIIENASRRNSGKTDDMTAMVIRVVGNAA